MEDNKNKRVKRNIKTKKLKNKEPKSLKKQGFFEKHKKIALFLKINLLLIIALIVAGTGIIIGMIYGGWGDDFAITKEELVIGSSNSIILDKDGNKLAELRGDENRKIIRLSEMPDNLKNAYIAIEDERFKNHHGIDFKRTGGAIFKYVISGGKGSFGGSTITQQLVKNITQDKERDGLNGILRKVKEWAKAYQIERIISKDQILELYLNIIFVGGDNNNLGVEIGSEYYFNKPAKDLDLAECAFLAGINHAPNLYNPFSENANFDRIKNRTKLVLNKMLELSFIDHDAFDQAIQELENGLKFEKGATITTIYSYHTDATISQAISDIAEKKGISKSLASTYLYTSGLTIYSTQDTNIQNKMNTVFVDNKDSYIKNSKSVEGATTQSAMVVIDNETGYVVGVEGGLGAKKESRGLNRATQSPRQTGSAIKTLTSLMPGINEGIITAATLYDDSKTSFENGTYNPKDYGAFKGVISIREATRTSQNIPFIKVVTELTPTKAADYLERMGVSTIEQDRNGLAAIAVGGFTQGITPLEMAGCYATIANNGVYRTPIFYTKIIDADGNIVIEPARKEERIISEQAAYVIKDLLKTVVQSGTATFARIPGIDVSAKSGTTNSNNDKWLCGFTNYYSGACWYGFDINEAIPSTNNYAGFIWSDVMKKIHEGKPSSQFTRPEGVVYATICKDSGKRATSQCKNTYSELFVSGTVPKECDAHSNAVKICQDSGLLANDNCPNVIYMNYSYKVDKEKLNLWKTNSSGKTAPTESCTQHSGSNNSNDSNNSNNEETPKIEESIPTIILNGISSMVINVGDVYSDAGAKATDAVDGDITNKIVTSGAVNTSKEGTYTITYTVKNSKGESTTVKRTIVVKSNEIKPEENPSGTSTTTTTDSSTSNPMPITDDTNENKTTESINDQKTDDIASTKNETNV